MTWVLASLVIVVLGATAVVASGRWGAMPELVDDRPVPALPDGPIEAVDLRQAQFAVVTRGYSPEQVDHLLARLANQLDQTALREDRSEHRLANSVDQVQPTA